MEAIHSQYLLPRIGHTDDANCGMDDHAAVVDGVDSPKESLLIAPLPSASLDACRESENQDEIDRLDLTVASLSGALSRRRASEPPPLAIEGIVDNRQDGFGDLLISWLQQHHPEEVKAFASPGPGSGELAQESKVDEPLDEDAFEKGVVASLQMSKKRPLFPLSRVGLRKYFIVFQLRHRNNYLFSPRDLFLRGFERLDGQVFDKNSARSDQNLPFHDAMLTFATLMYEFDKETRSTYATKALLAYRLFFEKLFGATNLHRWLQLEPKTGRNNPKPPIFKILKLREVCDAALGRGTQATACVFKAQLARLDHDPFMKIDEHPETTLLDGSDTGINPTRYVRNGRPVEQTGGGEEAYRPAVRRRTDVFPTGPRIAEFEDEVDQICERRARSSELIRRITYIKDRGKKGYYRSPEHPGALYDGGRRPTNSVRHASEPTPASGGSVEGSVVSKKSKVPTEVYNLKLTPYEVAIDFQLAFSSEPFFIKTIKVRPCH